MWPTTRRPPKVQRVWDTAYAHSELLYDDSEIARTVDIHKKIANRIVKDRYTTRGQLKARGGPITMPNPGHTTNIARVLEIHVCDSEGAIEVIPIKGRPILLWSSTQKIEKATGSLFAFPGMRVPNPQKTSGYDVTEAARIHSKWRDWRAPAMRGESRVEYPVESMNAPKDAIAIVYSSDKFDGKRQSYIHHFDNGVKAWVGKGRSPKAFYVSGGRLKLTPDGLER